MSSRKEPGQFLTPQRKIIPDRPGKNLQTTIGSRFGIGNTKNRTTQGLHPNYYDQLSTNAKQIQHNPEYWQLKTIELRNYLNSNNQINKRTIRNMFGWEEDCTENNAQSHNLLKQIGSKVQILIKENNIFKRQTSHSQVDHLRLQNQQLMKRMDMIEKGIIAQQRQPNQQQIQQQFKNRMSSHKRLSIQKIDQNHNKSTLIDFPIRKVQSRNSHQPNLDPQFSFNHKDNLNGGGEIISSDKSKRLKKFFTQYINTCVEENDDKIDSMKKYIVSLERRLANLEHIEKKIDHYRFQKAVKLQESQKKTKNFTLATPMIKGDQDILPGNSIDRFNQVQEPTFKISKSPQKNVVFSYFTGKPREIKLKQTPELIKMDEDLTVLRKENAKLQQQCMKLKLRYECEIENHIKDNAIRQQLILEIQKLEMQNRSYKSNKLWKQYQQS